MIQARQLNRREVGIAARRERGDDCGEVLPRRHLDIPRAVEGQNRDLEFAKGLGGIKEDERSNFRRDNPRAFSFYRRLRISGSQFLPGLARRRSHE
jgi:hypothetical protein